jgi:hypothetical protein
MNPKNSLRNLIVNFLPGLVLGVVSGSLLGAFVTPIAEARSARTPKAQDQSVLLATQDQKAR